ncbi:MAG: hypothetical protein JST54_23685 [Deltaproteobacteria bacterium]|nr:hypothetical protein [Deltaproteobacteria bacterium]
MRHARWLAIFALCTSTLAHAETDREKAQREIDQQMKDLVKPLPPPAARIIWEGLDSDKIAIDAARFELDDAKLSYGELEDLTSAAKSHKSLYDGAVDVGKHALNVNLTVHRTKVSLLEGLRTTTFKVSSSAGFAGQKGLEVTIKVKLRYDETQQDPKKRLKLDLKVEPKMVASVDDSPMPEPPAPVVHTTVTAVAANDAKPEATADEAAPETSDDGSSEPAPHGKGKKGKKARADKVKPEKVKAEKTKPEKHTVVAEAEKHTVVQTHYSQPIAQAPTAPVTPPLAISVDAGPPDAGPPEAGPPDAGPPDAGPMIAAAAPDAGPPAAADPAGNSSLIWVAVGVGVVVFGIVLALGLRNRKRGF